MKPVLILLLLLIINSNAAFGQATIPQTYDQWKNRADSSLKIKDFKSAAEAYTQAFKSLGWKGYIPDRMNAARA